MAGREPVFEQVKKTGQQMVENGHYASDTITSRLANVDNKWTSARDTGAYRKRKLQNSLNVQQVQCLNYVLDTFGTMHVHFLKIWSTFSLVHC